MVHRIKEGNQITSRHNEHSTKLKSFVYDGPGYLEGYKGNLVFFKWRKGPAEITCYCDKEIFDKYFQDDGNLGAALGTNRPPIIGPYTTNPIFGEALKFPSDLY